MKITGKDTLTTVTFCDGIITTEYGEQVDVAIECHNEKKPAETTTVTIDGKMFRLEDIKRIFENCEKYISMIRSFM